MASTSVPAARTASAAALTAVGSMSAMRRWTPSAASRWASARPMPLAAPVMTATRPFRFSTMYLSGFEHDAYRLRRLVGGDPECLWGVSQGEPVGGDRVNDLRVGGEHRSGVFHLAM